MPQNPLSPLSKATSIGPTRPGSDAPLDTYGSPLTARSIPDLLARFGLDPTDLGNVGSGVGHATIGLIDQPSEALMHALKPLAGSLEHGSALAAQLMSRAPAQAATPADLAFTKLLNEFNPSAINVSKLLLNDKVTGIRPPQRTVINAPSGFTFANPWSGQNEPGLLARRSPTLDLLDQIYRAGDERLLDKRASKANRVSGRWGQNINSPSPVTTRK